MTEKAINHFLRRFEETESNRILQGRNRRIGSELKFPLVTLEGKSVTASQTRSLWEFLVLKGWTPLADSYSKEIIGVTKKAWMNEHMASCETGFSKVEFSLAHTDNLIQLNNTIEEMRSLLREFSDRFEVAFLGFGIQPVTSPGRHLLMGEKSRNLHWDRIFGGNNHIAPEAGTDVHLFTINATNQVHIDVTMEEAADAINVFNGLAGAQLAMTTNSNIWKGRIDPEYKCLGEIFWDWWLEGKHEGRYGVPARKFHDLEDYFDYILRLPPVYVKRNGVPVALPHCPSFLDYYECREKNAACVKGKARRGKCGITPDAEDVSVERQEQDLEQHFTFFWHSARLSRYYTLENRVNDQQPPDEIMTIPALSLGIMENLGEALDLINEYPWEVLRQSRVQAARFGLKAEVSGIKISGISGEVLAIAERGLKNRGLGEEAFITPLKKRLELGFSPADMAAEVFRSGGAEGLVERLKLQ